MLKDQTLKKTRTLLFPDSSEPKSWGLKIGPFCGGAVKIAAATAENRANLVHSAAE